MKYDPKKDKHKLNLAIHIISKLDEAGFKRDKRFEFGNCDSKFAEHVYSRKVRDDMYVLVYTSCSNHKGYISVRNKGNDAIRVVAAYRPDSSKHAYVMGLSKHKRIYRTGTINAIGDRMLIQMRKAWKIGNNNESCKLCGAPKFMSKKGNLVCADLCWKSK